jgi:hypothetical protein
LAFKQIAEKQWRKLAQIAKNRDQNIGLWDCLKSMLLQYSSVMYVLKNNVFFCIDLMFKLSTTDSSWEFSKCFLTVKTVHGKKSMRGHLTSIKISPKNVNLTAATTTPVRTAITVTC